MVQDLFSLPVTISRPETLLAYNSFSANWISYGPNVRAIFGAADADPECAIVNAQAACVYMALESASGFRQARKYLKSARRHCASQTPREQEFIRAAHLWWKGATQESLRIMSELASNFPEDLVTAKWAQYLAFNLGDAASMLKVSKAVLPAHRKTAEAWSMHAFALEQTDEIDDAEHAARTSLSLKSDDAWAMHALAHIMETQGRTDEAIAFLSAQAPTWQHKSIFIREHNYWHLALFHLDRSDGAKALEIFDRHLWGEWPEFAQEQIGAISALWRLEQRGINVGARWNPIVEQVTSRWHEHILPFHDLHFIYALARAGLQHEARSFLASMIRHGAKDTSGVWDSTAIPCAQGLLNYVEGRFEPAADQIGRVLARLHLVGGSHAQRDVFVQTWVDASLRSGQHSAVTGVLACRARMRPASKEIERLIKRVAKAA